MKRLLIILNVLTLLALPLVFYSAFEFTEISTRTKINQADEAGVFNQDKLSAFLEEKEELTGYKKPNYGFAAWLTRDRPWQGHLLIPSVFFLVCNTVALLFVGKKPRKEES